MSAKGTPAAKGGTGTGTSRDKQDAKDDHTWRQPDGKPVSCVEKIKVLNQNLDEIRQLAQDALEDAILMGCDEGQVRSVLQRLVEDLQNPYRKNK
jgi:hypothetical protein